MPSQINIYCDESCHLEHDQSQVMVLGGVSCDRSSVRDVSEKIREIKKKHGFKTPTNESRGFEAKWVKVSTAKEQFYLDLVEMFFDDPRLSFRGVVVPNKHLLDHGAFDQTHDQFYYKMFYIMLKFLIEAQHQLRIFMDIKDTQGGPKLKNLHSFLSKKANDPDHKLIVGVEQIRSEESEIIQLADLLIGAIGYFNRGLNTSDAKLKIVEMIRTKGRGRFSPRVLNSTSPYGERKINLLVWQAQEW